MTDDTLIPLVLRAQRGDTRAFDALVRWFQNAAVAYARTLLPDLASAEDATQEAFVQAWRDLPRLARPAAFGGWLRRIVFKFCDRTRRSAKPILLLTETIPLPTHLEPAFLAEQADEAARVRAAVDALPCALREATLLYYLSDYTIQEIAAFLEMPSTTVKNRLHAARKQLRKELWTMTELMLRIEKPSQNDLFASAVLVRVLREFQQQRATDPHTANRDLLEQGRAVLLTMLASDAPLDSPAVHDGLLLLWHRRDWQALSALLMRYRTQPLSDSENAWALLHLANAIALSGSAAGAVLAHETFEAWLPSKTPVLSAQWPFEPASKSEAGLVYRGQEVRLLFLSQSAEFTLSYEGVRRGRDYLGKVDAALADITVTPGNHAARFYVLRMASNACEAAKDFDRALNYVQQMHALALGASKEEWNAELEAKALGHDMILARRRHDEPARMAAAASLTALLNAAEPGAGWVRGERHGLACSLTEKGQHDQALLLWEANAASGGQVNGWGWLLHAAALWQVSRDREHTLSLLREARAEDDREMTPLFAGRPEFADVQNDPEFLHSIGRN